MARQIDANAVKLGLEPLYDRLKLLTTAQKTMQPQDRWLHGIAVSQGVYAIAHAGFAQFRTGVRFFRMSPLWAIAHHPSRVIQGREKMLGLATLGLWYPDRNRASIAAEICPPFIIGCDGFCNMLSQINIRRVWTPDFHPFCTGIAIA